MKGESLNRVKIHKGIIYCIENDLNGKVYIGKTVQKLSSRIRTHELKSRVALNIRYIEQ